MRIWLDDERPMPPGFDCHVTTAQGAIDLLSRDIVTSISLDHDLGDEVNGTGYDVACFIEQCAYNGTLPLIEVSIHSANPVGRAKMENAILRAKEYWTDGKENECQIKN